MMLQWRASRRFDKFRGAHDEGSTTQLTSAVSVIALSHIRDLSQGSGYPGSSVFDFVDQQYLEVKGGEDIG